MSGGARAGRTHGTPDKFGYGDDKRRTDALLDELIETKALLATCVELSTPNPIELDIQAKTLDQCVNSLTRAHAKILSVTQYVNNCRVQDTQPTLWELELILDDLRPRGPIL